MLLSGRDNIKGGYPPFCTCVECSLHPEARNFPKRDSGPWRWVESWRRSKQASWTTNVLLVGGSLTLAAFLLYPAALAGWAEDNLEQLKQPNLAWSSSGLDCFSCSLAGEITSKGVTLLSAPAWTVHFIRKLGTFQSGIAGRGGG